MRPRRARIVGRHEADRPVRDAATDLTEFPNRGVARNQLVVGIRSIVVHPTVIFYRIGAAAIDIVRVVDGRRNLAAFFPSDRDS